MALADYMPKKQLPPPVEPQFKQSDEPRPRRYADEAMQMRQHVLDLEDAAAHWKALFDHDHAELEMLREEFARVKTERDDFHDRVVAIETSLQIAGKVILDAMQAPTKRKAKKPPQVDDKVEKALAEVEKALEPPPPISQ